MALRVIGAGMGRTGTLSLKLALEMLGFGPCHHMTELLADPRTGRLWRDVWDGRTPDWDAIYAGFASAVDFPTYRHYEALAAKWPDAKVILTVREPEKWWQSTYETIYRTEPNLRQKLGLAARALVSPWARQILGLMPRTGPVLWKGDFEGRFEDKAFAIEKFEAHNARVQAVIPPERLLVMEVRDGWGPLCAFLGTPVPDVPFPRVNDRASFLRMVEEGLAGVVAPRAEPIVAAD